MIRTSKQPTYYRGKTVYFVKSPDETGDLRGRGFIVSRDAKSVIERIKAINEEQGTNYELYKPPNDYTHIKKVTKNGY